MYDKRNDVWNYENGNYDEFAARLKTSVAALLGESAQVILITVEKANSPHKKALTILHTGDNMASAVYLDAFYEKFKNGVDLDELAGQIVYLYKEERHSGKYDVSFFTDYKQAEDHIICRLVNYEKNRDLLELVPHTRFLDLAIVYYYEIGSGEFGGACILVQNHHIEAWRIEKDQLHETAVRNTRKNHPYRLTTLTQLLNEMDETGGLLQEDDMTHSGEIPSMYVLTNEDMCYGAVNICFPDLLRVLRRQVGDDFYVLPSSIHECIILPDSMCREIPVPELRKMVRDVNAAFVEAEDVLGDSVYRYDMKKQALEVAV